MESPLHAPAAAHPIVGFREDVLLGTALLVLSAIPFINLTAIPAFVDEGSQLQMIWRVIEAGEWLAPLGYGKPLEVWPMIPLMRIGIQPLTAIRALHVLAGMFGAVLTYRLARLLTSRLTAFTCGVLFSICPFVVYLQRFALAEVLLCTAGLWVLLSVVRFAAAPTRKHAALLAAALLVAAFCKFPVGFVFLISMPLALALMPADRRRNLLAPALRGRLFASHAPVLAVALVVAVSTILRLRAGKPPGFGLQDLMTVGYGGQYDIASAIGVPRPTLMGELAAQLSWPVVILALIGLIAAASRPDWRQRWLLAMGTFPLLAIGLLPRFWYSRYLLFALPPLIICSVLGWQTLAARASRFGQPLGLAVLAACVCVLGYQSALLVFDPPAAAWSALDRFQYFTGWGSGFGFPQAARYIVAAPEPPARIYSLDGAGAYQLRNYLPASWGSRVGPIFYGRDGKLLQNERQRLDNLRPGPVWIVMSPQLLPIYLASSFGAQGRARLDLRPIAQFNKPGSHGQLAIYAATLR